MSSPHHDFKRHHEDCVGEVEGDVNSYLGSLNDATFKNLETKTIMDEV